MIAVDRPGYPLHQKIVSQSETTILSTVLPAVKQGRSSYGVTLSLAKGINRYRRYPSVVCFVYPARDKTLAS